MTSDLLAAYHQSVFTIEGLPGTLRPGVEFPGTKEFLYKYHARSAVIITAANPHSEPLDYGVNLARQIDLKNALAQDFKTVLNARGASATGDWVEESFCIFDCTENQLNQLMWRFSQNCVLALDLTEVPLLRYNKARQSL